MSATSTAALNVLDMFAKRFAIGLLASGAVLAAGWVQSGGLHADASGSSELVVTVVPHSAAPAAGIAVMAPAATVTDSR